MVLYRHASYTRVGVGGARIVVGGGVMHADSARWVQGLTGAASERETAAGELHTLLRRAAHAEANRRSGYHGVSGVELDDIAEQAASDAVLSILRRVGTFRGESRFTTWAYKFVVLEVSSKFARHAWRRGGRQLDPTAWDRLPDAFGVAPEESVETRALLEAVRCGVEVAMTPHQRRVFVALVVHETPLDVLVAELGTNRNAVYKSLFDARRKLRTYLYEHGFLDASPRPSAS